MSKRLLDQDQAPDDAVVSKQPRKQYTATSLVKMLNKEMLHHGFQYQVGLNVDIHPFDHTRDCAAGGLYFCELRHVKNWDSMGELMADVEVPEYINDNVRNEMVHMKLKKKAHAIIIRDPVPFMSHPFWQDAELCTELIRSDARFLMHIPREKQTPVMCDLAVMAMPLMIEYAVYQTEAACKVAIAYDNRLFKFILPELKTDQFILDLIRADPLVLEHISDRTQAQCDLAVSLNPMALEFTPKHFQSLAMCEKAVACNPNAIVDAEFQSPEMNKSVLAEFPWLIRYCTCLTKQICEDAVLQHYPAFLCVPAKLQTPKMCDYAVSKDPRMLSHAVFKTTSLVKSAKTALASLDLDTCGVRVLRSMTTTDKKTEKTKKNKNKNKK